MLLLPFETPENASEETDGAPYISRVEIEPSQEQAKVVAVRRLHGARGIVRRYHDLLDNSTECIEDARGGRGDLGFRV